MLSPLPEKGIAPPQGAGAFRGCWVAEGILSREGAVILGAEGVGMGIVRGFGSVSGTRPPGLPRPDSVGSICRPGLIVEFVLESGLIGELWVMAGRRASERRGPDAGDSTSLAPGRAGGMTAPEEPE